MIATLLAAMAFAAVPTPDQGLVLTKATISMGWPLHDRAHDLYLHGNADVFLSPRISMRGDVWWYLGEQHQRGELSDNHSCCAVVLCTFSMAGSTHGWASSPVWH